MKCNNRLVLCQGFTLLEVIIALGIVAVGILAVSRAITGYAETTITLEQRMVANWVAANRFETLRVLKLSPKVGTTHGSEEMAERVWYFRETTTATADPDLFRIDIAIFTDKEETDEVGQLYGYLLKKTELHPPVASNSFEQGPSSMAQRANLFAQNSFNWHFRVNEFAPTGSFHSTDIVASNSFGQGPSFRAQPANLSRKTYLTGTGVRMNSHLQIHYKRSVVVERYRHCTLSGIFCGHEHRSAAISEFISKLYEIASSQAPRNDEYFEAAFAT